jgi:hypothetical protein
MTDSIVNGVVVIIALTIFWGGFIYLFKKWMSDRKAPEALIRKGMPYVIVRTLSAGVFAGYLESRNGKEGVLRQVRRIWYWDGAASLSQLAVDGTSKPQNCKFPCEVDKIELTEIIEIITCTEKARQSISEVKIWQH